MVAEAGSRTATRGRIYLMGADGKPVAYNVRLGITDGTSTELLVGPMRPNADDAERGRAWWSSARLTSRRAAARWRSDALAARACRF